MSVAVTSKLSSADVRVTIAGATAISAALVGRLAVTVKLGGAAVIVGTAMAAVGKGTNPPDQSSTCAPLPLVCSNSAIGVADMAVPMVGICRGASVEGATSGSGLWKRTLFAIFCSGGRPGGSPPPSCGLIKVESGLCFAAAGVAPNICCCGVFGSDGETATATTASASPYFSPNLPFTEPIPAPPPSSCPSPAERMAFAGRRSVVGFSGAWIPLLCGTFPRAAAAPPADAA